MMTPHLVSHDLAQRRGMVLVMTAVLLPVIVGVMALALDGGLMYLQRRQAQSVADAAALAGAYQIYNGSNFSVARSAAIAIGTQNGFTISSGQVTQPETGYVSVTVTGSQPRFFSALWGSGSMSVTAKAVARGITTPYSDAALLVLAATGTSVTLSGTTQVTDINGNIVVDSTSSAAIQSVGTNAIMAPELDLSGNIAYSGINPNQATVTKYNQPYTPDPLASIAAPSSSGMTVRSNSAISITNTTSMTLNPGVYNGGISMSGTSSITLNPGVYYINGGINMTGGTSISGNGVCIYNTGGPINLSGTGNISLNPMTSGTYAGITLFQDRSGSYGVWLTGASNINNSGTFYLPNSMLTLTGGTTVGVIGAQFIAKTMAFSGNGGIKIDYDGSVASKSSFGLVQ